MSRLTNLILWLEASRLFPNPTTHEDAWETTTSTQRGPLILTRSSATVLDHQDAQICFSIGNSFQRGLEVSYCSATGMEQIRPNGFRLTSALGPLLLIWPKVVPPTELVNSAESDKLRQPKRGLHV